MKTVRLSEQLKHDIKRNALEKFEKANPKQTYPADGAKLLTKYGVMDKVEQTKTAFKEIWDRPVPMETVERVQLSSTHTVLENEYDYEKSEEVESKNYHSEFI